MGKSGATEEGSLPLGSSLAIRAFACFAGAYLVSNVLRSVNAVIAPSLISELQLTHADLGLLSSAYFAAFAVMQLPLGVWLDRYGARRTESILLAIAACGAVVFALSPSLSGLWLGRLLLGVGASACLMAPFHAFRQWHAPQRQAQLACGMLVAGTTGSLLSTLPVTAALPFIGWRGVFWVMAGLIALAAVALFWLVRKAERRAAAKVASTATLVQPSQAGSYRCIFGNPYFQRLALLGIVNQGIFIALHTLWAGPWMTTVLGLHPERASQALFSMNLALLAAYLLLAWTAPRILAQGKRHGISPHLAMTAGLVATILTQLLMLWNTGSQAWWLWLALAAFSTGGTITQTQINLAFPKSQCGRANAAYNLLIFVGAFGAQWGLGVLIDLFVDSGWSDAHAMRLALGCGIVLQIAALLVFVLHRARFMAHEPIA